MKAEDINMDNKDEFFLKKFMELQQANAAMYKVLKDLYEIEEVKKVVDEKMPSGFLDFVKKNLV